MLFETILNNPILAEKLNYKPDRGPQEGRLGSPAKPSGFSSLDAPYVELGLNMISSGAMSNAHAAATFLAEEMWKERGESKDKRWPGASEAAIIARIGNQLRKAMKSTCHQNESAS